MCDECMALKGDPSDDLPPPGRFATAVGMTNRGYRRYRCAACRTLWETHDRLSRPRWTAVAQEKDRL